MNTTVVYQHRRHDTNEIFYVGIGKEKRPYEKHTSLRSKWWSRIVNKTGYSIEILCSNLSWDEAVETEKYLIKYYGRKDLGLGNLVNLTDGGEGVLGRKISEETRDKIIKANTKLIVSKEDLYRMYITEDLMNKEICVILNTKRSTLKDLLKKYDLKKESSAPPLKYRKILDTNTGRVFSSTTECAEFLGVKFHTLLAGMHMKRDKYKHLIKI